MDWLALRKALTAALAGVCPNETEFARRAGLNRTTVRRVEDLSQQPRYRPGIDTIEAWLTAAGVELTVSEFLQEFESTRVGVTSGANIPSSNVARMVAEAEDVIAELLSTAATLCERADALRAAIDAAARDRGKEPPIPHPRPHRSR